MNDKNKSARSGDLLVIGYGNSLRRDDGVGIKTAEAIAALHLPMVHAIARHQLVPELAEAISQARAVLFIDADPKAGDTVVSKEIEPDDTGQILAHSADPRSLLALTRKLYGRVPPAWSLAIPVEDLAFGEGLSARAETGMQMALEKIRRFAAETPK